MLNLRLVFVLFFSRYVYIRDGMGYGLVCHRPREKIYPKSQRFISLSPGLERQVPNLSLTICIFASNVLLKIFFVHSTLFLVYQPLYIRRPFLLLVQPLHIRRRDVLKNHMMVRVRASLLQ